MEVSWHRATPIAGWFIVENPNLKWMMAGGTPMDWKPLYLQIATKFQHFHTSGAMIFSARSESGNFQSSGPRSNRSNSGLLPQQENSCLLTTQWWKRMSPKVWLIQFTECSDKAMWCHHHPIFLGGWSSLLSWHRSEVVVFVFNPNLCRFELLSGNTKWAFWATLW